MEKSKKVEQKTSLPAQMGFKAVKFRQQSRFEVQLVGINTNTHFLTHKHTHGLQANTK